MTIRRRGGHRPRKLAAFLEALDWVLIEPPEELELIHLLMTEIRAELRAAIATSAQPITEQGRGR